MVEQLLFGMVGATVIAVVSRSARFLSASGAVAQWLLGTVLLGIGGWQWTVPMLAFFLSSSIVSRMWKERRAGVETFFEKTSLRDAGQVFANGGVAGIVTLVWGMTRNDALYCFFAGAVAAAAADTWATELGTLSRSSPILLTTFRRVERGRSGAVSFAGLLAAVVGGLVVALSALPWAVSNTVAFVAAVTAGGILGSLADSLMGAVAQAQFRCTVCSRITELESHCNQQALHLHGARFLRNDQVNLFCTIAGGTSAYLFFQF
ncbi:MAG: hypothetical protein C4326_11820 [Ignavibacteria bacterium]